MEIKAKEHLESVIEEYNLDTSGLTWEVRADNRLTRTWANIHYKPNDHYLIKYSPKAVRRHGWDKVKSALRHELAHMMANYHHGETGEYGLHFRDYLNEFDAIVKPEEGASEPDYLIRCESCGKEFARFKRSKLVKKTHRYSCDCGGDLNRVK